MRARRRQKVMSQVWFGSRVLTWLDMAQTLAGGSDLSYGKLCVDKLWSRLVYLWLSLINRTHCVSATSAKAKWL